MHILSVFTPLESLVFIHTPCCVCRRETVLLTVSQDLDVDKLGRVDELARNIGQDKHQVLVAYWQLRAIASSPGTFGLTYRLLAYLMMAASAAPLFFGGTRVFAMPYT